MALPARHPLGVTVLGSFLIFAREGIEGTMVCSILLGFVASAGRRDLGRWIWGGAAAAVAVSLIAGVALWVWSRSAFVGSVAQTWFETGVFLVAVVLLTYMTFWMRRHARTLGREIRQRAGGAVAGGSGLALALVAFATVGREGVETVIFTLAIAYQSSPLQLGAGAVLGLALALAISVAMYRLGRRINLGRFFAVVGSLLLVVAAGMLANAIENLQQLGVIAAGPTLWNTSGALSEDSGLGDVLHGLVGYSAQPSLLQAALWLVFLAGGLALYLRRSRPVTSAPAVALNGAAIPQVASSPASRVSD